MWFPGVNTIRQLGSRILSVLVREKEYQPVMAMEPRWLASQERSAIPEKILKEIHAAFAEVNRLEQKDDINSLREALHIIDKIDNKYPYAIVRDLPRIHRGRVAFTLIKKKNYDKVLRVQKQIEDKLMADPNIVSVYILPDSPNDQPNGEYKLCIEVLSLEIYLQKQTNKNEFMQNEFVQFELTDDAAKSTVCVRVIETTMPAALSKSLSAASQTEPGYPRVVTDDSESSSRGPSCPVERPQSSHAFSLPLSNQMTSQFSGGSSSRQFKYAVGAGISFFTIAAMTYHFAPEASDDIKSTTNDSHGFESPTTQPDYIRLTEVMTPEQQQAIDAYNEKTEEGFRKFSNY